jgi:hypothetical protein
VRGARERRQVAGKDVTAILDRRIAVREGEHLYARVEGQQIARGVLDVGAAQHRGRERRDAMIGADRIAERNVLDIADIAIDARLAPGPAILAFEDGDGFAEQNFVVLHRIR